MIVRDVDMLIRRGILLVRCRKVNRFLTGADQAGRIQRRLLFEKLRRNADSDLGRDFGFAHIRSVEDFRRQVPLTSYEDYRPYIERVKRGDSSAMFAPGTRVLMFTMTSGTTAEPKFIPITRQFLREYRRGWSIWGDATYRDHKKLLGLLNLQLFSDWRKFHTECGIPCGSISGLAVETAPAVVSRPIFLDLRPLMKIEDPLAKHYTALRLAVGNRRVGIVMTANPSTLIEFSRVADRHREKLVRDICDGTLSAEFDVPAAVRAKLGRRIRRRDPRRARALERIIERSGSLLPRDFWPELQVVSVWTGGPMGAFLPQMREYFGNAAVRDHGISASEGRMTIPFADETAAGVLDYTSQYFEFIPEEEHGTPGASVLEAHELEVGRKYFVVMTTSSGFYRYDIHDLVACVGFQGQAPLLEFQSKGAHFSSMTGEKLSEYQAATAVQRAFEDFGLRFGQFTVAPRWGDPPRYVLLIEPGPHMQRSEALAERIDLHLGELNMEYADRLKTNRLQPLVLQQVPERTWDTYRQRALGQCGGSLEQYKHPCLTNDLEFVDKLGLPAGSASGKGQPAGRPDDR